MPRSSEFEEKEYEGFLYPCLVQPGSHSLWTPGQVLEGHLGFDAALQCKLDYWKIVNRPHAPGVALASFGLAVLLPKRGSQQALPSFQQNLFIQAKRTWQYVQAPNAIRKLLSEPWRYFDLEAKQQADLCKLAKHLGSNAEVTYACANLMTKEELFTHGSAGNLVAHSTFPTALSLKNHERWYFNSAGASGYGHSEPEAIEALPLLSRLANFEQQELVSGELAEQQLMDELDHIWSALLSVWGEGEYWDEGSGGWIESSYAWLFSLAWGWPSNDPASFVAKILAVLDVIGIRWAVIGSAGGSP